MGIKRLEWDRRGTVESVEGDLILYTDHIAEMEAASEKARQEKATLEGSVWSLRDALKRSDERTDKADKRVAAIEPDRNRLLAALRDVLNLPMEPDRFGGNDEHAYRVRDLVRSSDIAEAINKALEGR